jgi:hypothetical protein
MPHTESFTIVAVVLVSLLVFRNKPSSDGRYSTEQECSSSIGCFFSFRRIGREISRFLCLERLLVELPDAMAAAAAACNSLLDVVHD